MTIRPKRLKCADCDKYKAIPAPILLDKNGNLLKPKPRPLIICPDCAILRIKAIEAEQVQKLPDHVRRIKARKPRIGKKNSKKYRYKKTKGMK